MAPWAEVEPHLRERAYRTLNADPQILLEHSGGPDSLDVDLLYARLLGFDDQIVEDGLLLSRLDSRLLLPIPARPMLLAADSSSAQWEMEPVRVAEYELQSAWATVSVSAEFHPPVDQLRPDSTARIGYVRYRRTA